MVLARSVRTAARLTSAAWSSMARATGAWVETARPLTATEGGLPGAPTQVMIARHSWNEFWSSDLARGVSSTAIAWAKSALVRRRAWATSLGHAGVRGLETSTDWETISVRSWALVAASLSMRTAELRKVSTTSLVPTRPANPLRMTMAVSSAKARFQRERRLLVLGRPSGMSCGMPAASTGAPWRPSAGSPACLAAERGHSSDWPIRLEVLSSSARQQTRPSAARPSTPR